MCAPAVPHLPPHLPPSLPPLEDGWCWECGDGAKRVGVKLSQDRRTVHFHSSYSSGTAATRGSRRLNHGRFYWELRLSDRLFGTSIQVGVATARARMGANTFVNMIGEDEHGWSLSHKGLLWHGGLWSPYTDPFPENQATTIGLLFDGIAGTLGFFKDHRWLGVAFTGLNQVSEPLYPVVSSTAKGTEISLVVARWEVGSLAERCRAEVVRLVPARADLLHLPLPRPLMNFIADAVVTPVVRPARNPAYRLLL